MILPRPHSRRVTAWMLAAATALLIGGLGVAAYQMVAPEAAGDAGVARVTITGPDGVIWNGTVPLDANATALDALLDAADAGGFHVKTRAYAMGTYVYAVDGHEAEGATGWVYEVERDGAREWADRAADRYVVTDGDVVHWSWSDAPPRG